MNCTSWESLEEGKLLLVKLARPKANILDAEMIGELHKGLEEKVGASTRAVILSQEGPHFSFGASVEEHTRDKAKLMLDTFHGMFRAIHEMSVPILVAVKGQCLGGGLELASFGHMLFAHPESKFGQPEIVLGVFPPMASLILNIKAPALADEINLSGRIFSANEFKEAGLVNKIDEDPESAAIAFARKNFLPKSALCLRHGVRANRWRFDSALSDLLPRLEKQYVEELMSSADANEGIQAFLDKRSAVWCDK
ncbi:MAG: cyclohexa-1,5-dienecarbonyl-CoA hydratase [Proteobacteria bacterium]|nr:cyclohexa-1,5-dienecarbonyl-CoA hydratase [Pseudomonadota bacterium]